MARVAVNSLEGEVEELHSRSREAAGAYPLSIEREKLVTMGKKRFSARPQV